MFKNIVTILFFVDDILKSAEWYGSLLEIQPIELDSKFASFRMDNHFINFHLADSKSPLSPGGSVCYWQVDHLDSAIERARQAGGSVYRGQLFVKETNRTICQIMDPYGNVFGLESDV